MLQCGGTLCEWSKSDATTKSEVRILGANEFFVAVVALFSQIFTLGRLADLVKHDMLTYLIGFSSCFAMKVGH